MTLDKKLHQLEMESAEELEILASVGATYFSTNDLIRLKGRLELKQEQFFYLQKIMLVWGLLAPAWVMIAVLAGFLGMTNAYLICLMIFPIDLFVLFVFRWLVLRYYKGNFYMNAIAYDIKTELRSRRKREKH